jgi:hypothetical protein
LPFDHAARKESRRDSQRDGGERRGEGQRAVGDGEIQKFTVRRASWRCLYRCGLERWSGWRGDAEMKWGARG